MKVAICSLLALVFGCGVAPPGEPPPTQDHCTPAAQVNCSCPDGTESVKQCKSDGTWGDCQCVGQ